MNKQALAFISMFSLILMLSIYYVSLSETPEDNRVVNNVESVMMLMKKQNEEKKESRVLELKQVLGKADSSEEKKQEVLNEIETIENNKINEKAIMDELDANNIQSVVTIENNMVKVNVFELEKSKEKADEIMKIVYSKIKPNQSIELVFS